MKFRVENMVVFIIWLAVVSCGAATGGTHFRSVGKNYNINYNSNANTNFDFARLYDTLLKHISGSEIKDPSSPFCHGGRCQQLYEHFAASFSSDQDEDESVLNEDYFDDYVYEEDDLFPTVGSVVKEPAQGIDPVAKSTTDDAAVQIRQEVSVAVPLVNQTNQIFSFDSISVE